MFLYASNQLGSLSNICVSCSALIQRQLQKKRDLGMSMNHSLLSVATQRPVLVSQSCSLCVTAEWDSGHWHSPRVHLIFFPPNLQSFLSHLGPDYHVSGLERARSRAKMLFSFQTANWEEVLEICPSESGANTTSYEIVLVFCNINLTGWILLETHISYIHISVLVSSQKRLYLAFVMTFEKICSPKLWAEQLYPHSLRSAVSFICSVICINVTFHPAVSKLRAHPLIFMSSQEQRSREWSPHKQEDKEIAMERKCCRSCNGCVIEASIDLTLFIYFFFLSKGLTESELQKKINSENH